MSLSGDDASSNGRRHRVSRACDLCRRKKIKCDGLNPVCSNCQVFSLKCTYNDTTKKRGPPKGYIEAIENRLYKLEQLLEDLTSDQDNPKAKAVLQTLHAPLETATGEQIRTRPVRRGRGSNKNRTFLWQSKGGKDGSTETRNAASSSPGSPISSQLMSSPALGHEDISSSPETVNDSKGQLSMDESGQVRYLGKSSGFYLLQESRTYQNGAFHLSGWSRKKEVHDKATPLDPFALPPKDLSTNLVLLYFKHFYPLLPLFYKKRLVSSTESPTGAVSPLLLNAIYAIAARVSSDLRVRSEPEAADTAGDVFFERAKKLLEDYTDVPRISTVQALLLMASHQHGSGKSARAWLYSGMAFRMAQDLGLHRNCDNWNIPPDERERRKRVFWCCFIVDRLLSATLGRAFIFEERDCDVPFPAVDDDEELRTESPGRPPARLLDVFVQLIKICDILGHVLKNIYYTKAHSHAGTAHIDHVLSALNRELSNWYNGLPLPLQYKLNEYDKQEGVIEPASPISQMHMIYYTTVILLHRPFIPGPSYEASAMSLPSYNICTAAADAILDMAGIMLNSNHLRYVLNFNIYYIFTAGIIFIKSASSGETRKAIEAKVKVNKIMRALDEIELTWITAARCCNILGELAGLRDINLEHDGQNRGKGEAESSVMSLASLPASTGMSTPSQSNNMSIPSSGFPLDQWNTPRTPTGSTRQDYADNSRFGWMNDASGFQENALLPTSDPFAAPGTILGQSQNQFDPMGSAFWGVPPSLDIEQWNNYLGTQQNNTSSQPYQPPPNQPLIPSNQFSPMQDRSTSVGQPSTKQRLIHADQQVDMLSGMSTMPNSPSGSVLLGYMGRPTESEPNPNRIPQTSYDSSDKLQPSDSRDHNTTDLMYW